MISFVSIFIFVFGLYAALGGVQDPRFLTSCSFAGSRFAEPKQHACHVALFSNKHFLFAGSIVSVEHDLCSLETVQDIGPMNLAVLVKRGKCSFATKAKVAQGAGFKLVIIANSEEEGFPVGPPEVDFALDIPVMMVGQKVWDDVAVPATESIIFEHLTNGGDTAEHKSSLDAAIAQLSTVSVQFAPHVPPQVAAPAQAQGTNTHAAAVHPTAALNAGIVRALFAVVAVVAVVLLLIVFFSTTQHHLGTTHHSRSTPGPTSETATSYTTCIVQLLVYVLLIVVFVALRLGTLRIYGTDDSGEVVHNHKETDERVFEALVHNVLNGPYDYRLHPHTIQELQLAEENYSDSVFIHPPLFVFMSAALYKYCNVLLPLVPLVLQIVALCLLPVICNYVLSSVKYAHVEDNMVKYSAYFSDGEVYNIGVLSMILLSCCPIAAFSSQKFWIDNGLMMSVTVCVAAHVVLLHRSTCGVGADTIADSSCVGITISTLFQHAISGLIFGLVGFNCKITAAALVVFCIGYIILQQYTRYTECCHYLVHKGEMSHTKHTSLLRGTVVEALVYCAVFGLCAALAYAPWMYIYWVRTGRLTPNAWPSATMLERSSFVRTAVRKPWYTYLHTLLTVAPVHVVGVVGALVVGLCSACGVLRGVVCGLGVLWGSSGGSSNVHETVDCIDTVPTTNHTHAPSTLRHRNTATTPITNTSDTAIDTISAPTHHQSPALLTTSLDPTVLSILVFALWPVGFLVGLTFLGSLGSGFQSRFLMPMLPGSAILSAVCVVWVQRTVRSVGRDGVRRRGDMHSQKVLSVACTAVLLLCMMYSMVHVFYYGVLYAPLFADLDVSVVDVLCSVLQSVYFPADSRESFQATLKFMSHFGLVRDSK